MSAEDGQEHRDSDDLNGEVVTVGALNSALADIVETDAPHFDYLIGDCSDRYVSSAGHLHFDLVHEDNTLHCIVFEFRRDWLTDDVSEDAHLAVKGDLSYYAEEGQVSVIVEEALKVGDSEYEAIYRENRKALANDGLLDDDAKQPLPEHPTTIGIATSAESDAREDAITGIHSRHPDIDVVIQDTPVQGESAIESLLEAISILDRDASIDVIVVTRGGGADKHLRVFNDIALCRVIANTDTPIIAAIGHENDTVLAGEVADARAMTPTHVGETALTYNRDAFLEHIGEQESRVEAAYARHARDTLTDLAASADTAYTSLVGDRLGRLEQTVTHQYEAVATETLTAYQHRVDNAFQQFQQQYEHQAETATYKRRQKLLIALVLLLLGVVLTLIFFLP